jgi:hypothetical protein
MKIGYGHKGEKILNLAAGKNGENLSLIVCLLNA